MLVVGLTSGIGCGKSTVARFFHSLGASVIDADLTTRKLYASDRQLAGSISRAFGKRFLTRRGKVDRKALSKVVFSERRLLSRLNKIVHPAIIREIKRELSALRKNPKTKLVVLDAPLLLETGIHKLCDSIVVVTLPQKLQVRRLLASGLSRKECLARISAQLPLREKVKIANYVIDNSGSRADTKKQVLAVFRELGEDCAESGLSRNI